MWNSSLVPAVVAACVLLGAQGMGQGFLDQNSTWDALCEATLLVSQEGLHILCSILHCGPRGVGGGHKVARRVSIRGAGITVFPESPLPEGRSCTPNAKLCTGNYKTGALPLFPCLQNSNQV